ncbi:MAG: DNA repair protein RecO [Ignavibacteriota bacterium]
MLVSSEAVVLRSRKQGDTSKIVALYTNAYGLIDVIAKGAREMKSKFGSALEPFTCSKVTFYKKAGKELYLLSGAETVLPFRNLQSDLDHIEAATDVIELLLRSQHHEESHPELFSLVKETLGAIDAAKEGPAIWPVLYTYYIRYIHYAGFQMQLESRSTNASRVHYFDVERGEVIEMDGNARGESERLHKLSPESLACLQHIGRSTISAGTNLRVSAGARHTLENLFRSYFAFHIEGMQHNRSRSGRVFSAIGK